MKTEQLLNLARDERNFMLLIAMIGALAYLAFLFLCYASVVQTVRGEFDTLRGVTFIIVTFLICGFSAIGGLWALARAKERHGHVLRYKRVIRIMRQKQISVDVLA